MERMLGIYGSGGAGRDIADAVCQIQRCERSWGGVVFIDDLSDAEEKNGVSLMRYEEFLSRFSPDDSEICVSFGEPRSRKRVAEKVVGDGYQLATVIHPNVWIPETTSVGEGSILLEGCRVGCNVSIGSNVLALHNLNIAHDTSIGRHCLIASASSCAGGVRIGESVYLGIGSMIKEGTVVGDDSIVSMGSIVMQDVPPRAVVMGNPARVIRKNTDGAIFK